MATTLSTAGRNAACNGVVDAVDAGSSFGKIRIKNGGGTVIAEVTLEDPAFGAASTGVATLLGVPIAGAGVTAAGAGDDSATFDVTDSDNNVIWSGACGTGSGELDMVNVNVADGQVVTVTGMTHTQPATVE